MRRRRLVIPLGQYRWGGGIDVVRYIVRGLAALRDEHGFDVLLLVPDNSAPCPGPPNNEKCLTSLFRWYGARANAAVTMRDLPDPETYTAALSDLGDSVDVATYNTSRGGIAAAIGSGEAILGPVLRPVSSALGVPWMGYVVDVQHRDMPGNFSLLEWMIREWVVRRMVKRGTSLLTNSRKVREDLERLFPRRRCKIFDLPFCPAPERSWFEVLPYDVRTKYGLAQRYFIICNQFWIHKSHETAFRALAMLANEPELSDVQLVCTGKMEDYRAPGYGRELRATLARLELRDRVRLLGYIEKADQVRLLMESVAVVQPTLYEGGPGGGSVYEAIATGTPAIVSDIPVNREIREPGVVFFKAGDPHDLAGKMREALHQVPQRSDRESLFRKGETRLRLLGSRLAEAIEYAASNK